MRDTLRGMSFIDVIVGTAILLTVFVALVGVLRASLLISAFAKATAAATSLANNQIEYVRSLPYTLVGTTGGIPSGPIAQETSQVLDGLTYTVRTFIAYVDDSADGLGGSDTNGITTDYKRVKVTASYTLSNTTRDITLVSNYVPQGIETTVGGGTLQITVVDVLGVGVPSATVTIQNTSVTPAVDFTTYTPGSGLVSFPGAASGTGYQIYVSKSGYSSAQTYDQTSQNQNPAPGHLTVSTNQTTTGTFAIDYLSTLTLRTFSATLPPATTTPPLPNISFTLTGAKTIGSTSGGSPIYKAITTASSGESAEITLTLEWDAYTPSVSGYDIVDACPAPPYALVPNSSSTATLTLGTDSTNSLRVTVFDNVGVVVSGATVELTQSGFTDTKTSSTCGAAYFGDLASASDYTVTISKTGYATTVFTNVSVSGEGTYVAAFL